MNDPLRAIDASELLPHLLDLVAEIAVDRASTADDVIKRLKHSLSQAGKKRHSDIGDAARVLGKAPATLKTWGWDSPTDHHNPPVRGLRDAIRTCFEDQESWSFVDLHDTLVQKLRGVRSGWSEGDTRTILNTLQKSSYLQERDGKYELVYREKKSEDFSPLSSEQYRDLVDYRIYHWAEVAKAQRNASEEDLKSWERYPSNVVRAIGPGSYVAHDFYLKAKEGDHEKVHEIMEGIIKPLRPVVEKLTPKSNEERSMVHFQLVHKVMPPGSEPFA